MANDGVYVATSENKWDRFKRYCDQHIYDGPMVDLTYGLEAQTCSVCGNLTSDYDQPCIDKNGKRRWDVET